jgi:hypothetical protein
VVAKAVGVLAVPAGEAVGVQAHAEGLPLQTVGVDPQAGGTLNAIRIDPSSEGALQTIEVDAGPNPAPEAVRIHGEAKRSLQTIGCKRGTQVSFESPQIGTSTQIR